MSRWLLDTNIVSELRKPNVERGVAAFMAGEPLNRLFLSVVTLAEIRFGIDRLATSARRVALNDWLSHRLRPMFEGRILAVGEDVMLRWRLMVDEGRKVGHTFPQPDLIIAATALHHGLTLVTRDTTDFARTSVMLFNPWLDPLPTPSGPRP